MGEAQSTACRQRLDLIVNGTGTDTAKENRRTLSRQQGVRGRPARLVHHGAPSPDASHAGVDARYPRPVQEHEEGRGGRCCSSALCNSYRYRHFFHCHSHVSRVLSLGGVQGRTKRLTEQNQPPAPAPRISLHAALHARDDVPAYCGRLLARVRPRSARCRLAERRRPGGRVVDEFDPCHFTNGAMRLNKSRSVMGMKSDVKVKRDAER